MIWLSFRERYLGPPVRPASLRRPGPLSPAAWDHQGDPTQTNKAGRPALTRARHLGNDEDASGMGHSRNIQAGAGV